VRPSTVTNGPLQLSSVPPDSILYLRHWRKYRPTYKKHGFIAVEHGRESLPQCVICMKTLANSAMKRSLLKRHLSSVQIILTRTELRITFSDLARTSSGSAWTRLAQYTRERRVLSKHRMKSLSW